MSWLGREVIGSGADGGQNSLNVVAFLMREKVRVDGEEGFTEAELCFRKRVEQTAAGEVKDVLDLVKVY